MNKNLLILVAVAMIWFGWNGIGSAATDATIIPLQTAAPAPVKAPIAPGRTPQEVCNEDRTMIFVANEHHEPSQLKRNQIRFGCLDATWAWSFTNFAR